MNVKLVCRRRYFKFQSGGAVKLTWAAEEIPEGYVML